MAYPLVISKNDILLMDEEQINSTDMLIDDQDNENAVMLIDKKQNDISVISKCICKFFYIFYRKSIF
jgi:hypothetical protein